MSLDYFCHKLRIKIVVTKIEYNNEFFFFMKMDKKTFLMNKARKFTIQ